MRPIAEIDNTFKEITGISFKEDGTAELSFRMEYDVNGEQTVLRPSFVVCNTIDIPEILIWDIQVETEE